jgi:hypothetical protein
MTEANSAGLRAMAGSEFVRRMRAHADDSDRHLVFWLGAGCSVTSGIPASAALVREDWLPKLQRFRGGSGNIDAWAREVFPDYDPESPSALYGVLMEELFTTPHLKQWSGPAFADSRGL